MNGRNVSGVRVVSLVYGLKITHYASVLELVYRLVPKTSVERLAGSEPARSTRTVVGPTVCVSSFSL